MFRRKNLSVLSLFISFILLASCTQAETSKLWGPDGGELWSPASRLPDFSFAGYQSSKKPIPTLERSANVKDFGAKGNGKADDTEAFMTAIESAPRGVIFVPRGKYKITQVLRIQRRGIVFQGEGPDNTVLFFPNPLEEVVGPGKTSSPSGSWSWDGGFIWFQGDNRGERLATITSAAKRGATTFKVSNIEKFHAGQRVRLVMVNTDGGLGKILHADKAKASALLAGKTLVDFSCSVVSIGQNQITIDRPVRVDVNLDWKPTFESNAPTVEDVGIENLTIHFPVTRYAGHHDEPGYNAITFQGVQNGWVRNVHIVNADSGVIFRARAKFCTIENVELRNEEGRARGMWEAHHGFEVADLSQDNLFTGFKMQTRFIHSISLTSMASGNVFMKGSGTDMTFDHHRKAPYENLFTDIDAGVGSDLWASGGDEDAGPYSGARETFWNVRAARPQGLPGYAIQWNLIGITTNHKSELKTEGNWLEAIDPSRLTPANLFDSQLARRRLKNDSK